MVLVAAFVFLGVFAVVTLLLIAVGIGASRQSKQVLATLDSALATETPQARDQMLDLRKSDALSSIPWLNRKLHEFEVSRMLKNLLQQAHSNWTAGSLVTGTGVAFAIPAYALYFEFHSLPIALLCGLLVGSAPFDWVLFKRRKRFKRFEQGLPEALDMMVSALRAGHSLIAAMGLVARECADPVGGEFRICFDEQNYGLELKTAMENMTTRVPLQDLRIVSTAIMIQKESGGSLSEVVDKTAHVIRERFRLKRQVSVHTAQGRLTGWILTALPFALGVLFYLANPEMMSLLWTTPLGIKCLWLAGGLLLVGGFTIHKIVNMDV